MHIGVIKECVKLMRKFLWRATSEEENKIAWVKWKTICRPKEEGGLGVKELGLFNKAILEKIGQGTIG